MSYEGYVQRLCKNGHYHSFDCYTDPDPEEWECPNCGEKCVWVNNVDQTNGSFDEDGTRIDGYIELEETEKSKAAICTCDKCGSKHRTAPQTFKIPKKRK